MEDFRVELELQIVELLAESVVTLLELLRGELVFLVVVKFLTQLEGLCVSVRGGLCDAAALGCGHQHEMSAIQIAK